MPKTVLYQDESLCPGEQCDLRDNCLRYRYRPAEPREYQRWGQYVPDNLKQECLGLIEYVKPEESVIQARAAVTKFLN